MAPRGRPPATKQNAGDKRADFDAILAEYRESYDIDSIATPNDRANLDTIIMNTLAVRRLQAQLLDLAIDDVVANATDIKKINDSIRDLTNINLTIERQLSIDRKTRKTESEQSVVEYINWLKSAAKDFLDDSNRLLKVYCKKCNIMVGRISGVYDTTEYTVEFQCPQCNKFVKVTRKQKDIFFDIRDAEWRRKYPMQIIQPAQSADAPDFGLDDGDSEIVISAPDTINDVTYDDTDEG
jgi:hypothetical protein